MKTASSSLPGMSTLARDYFDNFERVADFYDGDYRKPENFLDRAGKIKERELPLTQLVPILKEQNQKFGCSLPTLERIDWLLERRACTVVTGQQTGLFGGPLFTLYKALTAIKLAERLGRTCEGCYVPVFWLASDDHDFREVNHVDILNKGNEPSRITYQGHPADSKVPVSRIVLQAQIQEAIAHLDEQTHPSDFKQEMLTYLAEAYAPGNTFSQAFGQWLMTLLKPFGLVMIDASDQRIKALATSLFGQEIRKRSPSSQAALGASQELLDRGYHNQVQLHDGMLNLFYAKDDRSALQKTDSGFTIRSTGERETEAGLLARLAENPGDFSPNVLLRPLYQDVLLPTIAYIAGTAETAYYAQMKGIYTAFKIPMPVIYPRKSLTLLEPKIEKVLDNYALAVPQLWSNIDSLISKIAREQLPDELEDKIGAVTRSVNDNIAELQKIVSEFDPTLADFVKNSGGRIEGQIEGMEKKILQAFKKRNEIIRQQLKKAGNSLYPNNTLQERSLSVLPYLFKHGPGFIDQIYEAMDISNFDHQIVRI